MVLAPLNVFVKEFFLLKNYRNGWHGLVYSLLYAHYYLIKHLKLLELENVKKR